MCFHAQQTTSSDGVHRHFGTKGPIASRIFNGFSHPQITAITDKNPEETCLMDWGLIPHWGKDPSIKRYTLNARMETLSEKPAYRSAKRCLVLVDGFFEWQWLDAHGKQKQKHLIGLPSGKPFAMAGLWDEWANPETGEIIQSLSIVTTAAEGIMREIHNSKQRMPIVLLGNEKTKWLNQKPI